MLSIDGYTIWIIKKLENYPINTIIEFCEIAINQNSDMMRSINASILLSLENLKEVNSHMLSKNGLYLKYVYYQTYKLCEIAIMNDHNAIQYVNKKWIGDRLYKQLIELAEKTKHNLSLIVP